jgi:hypothetical protein
LTDHNHSAADGLRFATPLRLGPVGQDLTMMIEKTAKEIFMEYGGSHFFMEREGDYQRYKAFQVSKEQELVWVSELQVILLDRLDSDYNDDGAVIKYCQTLTQYGDTGGLLLLVNTLINIRHKADSFTKLLMAECLLKVVRETKLESNVSQQTYDAAIKLLREVIELPVQVSSKYEECGYLDDVIIPENILARAQSTLENAKMNNCKGRNRRQLR